MKQQEKKINNKRNYFNCVVLLILAGVSIAMLTGNNGILSQAQRAKTETEDAQAEEENILNSYEDEISEYAGIDWDEAMENAKAPESQDEERNQGVIGIGTNGKAVDMDLWEYSLLEDGTYVLSDNDTSNGYGYRGSIDSNGSIIGKIPQYISIDNGISYKPVTSLAKCMVYRTDLKIAPKIPDTVNNIRDMFYQCTGLIEMSNLPNSITEMWGTFNGCTSLKTVPEIPNGVNEMVGTFFNCTSLVTIPNFPSELNDMSYAFVSCTKLEKVPVIPQKVTNMRETFWNCVNLTTVEKIPESVDNLIGTFGNCAKLSGEMEINANITDSSNISNMFGGAVTEDKLKIKGNCPILNIILSQANNPNITL